MKKVWQPATLQPLEAHEQVVPFWKPPISHCLEPGGHGGGKTFRSQKPHSKMAILKVFLQGIVVFPKVVYDVVDSYKLRIVKSNFKIKINLIFFQISRN